MTVYNNLVGLATKQNTFCFINEWQTKPVLHLHIPIREHLLHMLAIETGYYCYTGNNILGIYQNKLTLCKGNVNVQFWWTTELAQLFTNQSG